MVSNEVLEDCEQSGVIRVSDSMVGQSCGIFDWRAYTKCRHKVYGQVVTLKSINNTRTNDAYGVHESLFWPLRKCTESDGATDCLRTVGPDFEAELTDDRNRLGAFDGPLTLPAKLSMV
jgi:hypothetical protein